MRVNQLGEPIYETTIVNPWDWEDDHQLGTALILLAEHLGLEFMRTNCTKDGDEIITLQEKNK